MVKSARSEKKIISLRMCSAKPLGSVFVMASNPRCGQIEIILAPDHFKCWRIVAQKFDIGNILFYYIGSDFSLILV